MRARLRQWLQRLADAFWLLPALLVAAGVVGAVGLVDLDRGHLWPDWLVDSAWVYNGGGTGARTLLGAIVSSTIGVAGTVFSITIAALSLAAGQMGPRLLRNFTHDRGVQATLGIFLGTFSYALMVLRSVRTQAEGAFTPHLSMTVGLVLAFVCIGALVYFVDHMAGRINVDTVIGLVGADLRVAVDRLTAADGGPAPPPEPVWDGAATVRDPRRGYLQELDAPALARWAVQAGVRVRLRVRPGDAVFPGAPVAEVVPATACEDAAAAIRRCSALGGTRVSSADLEYYVRQLVEVAVRALSPGINDPNTAISVLDRLGESLCDVARVQLPRGVHVVDGQVALVVPAVDYDGLADAMFHMIRQNAAGSAPVLIRLLEVLAAVASCEADPARRGTLRRHADLVLEDARREIATTGDRQDVERRHARLVGACAGAGGQPRAT